MPRRLEISGTHTCMVSCMLTGIPLTNQPGKNHLSYSTGLTLYGVDCRTPTEAALLPPSDATIRDLDLEDYREQVVLTLQSARDLAVRTIKKAQDRYKHHYDTGARCTSFKIGDWVFVRFPQEETGRLRKLSRPWHRPYRITTLSGPDVCVTGVYLIRR